MNNLLILLIGGNPIPNYVVGKYLLSNRQDLDILPKPNYIAFIFSKNTKLYAESIQRQLIEEGLISKNCLKDVNLDVDERNLIKIDQELKKMFDIFQDLESINLNYTGGTKPMVIQSYISTKSFFDNSKKSNQKMTFYLTDLDPDNFKINCKLNNQLILLPQEADLRKFVQISMNDLLKMHLITKVFSKNECSEYSTPIIFSKLFKYFENIDKNGFQIFQDWIDLVKNHKKRKINNKNIYYIKKVSSFQKMKENLNCLGLETEIKLKEFNEKDNDDNSIQIRAEWLKVANFLKGGWLEDYIFILLSNLNKSKKISLSMFAKNVKAYIDDRDTELDIICLIGFQLFLISVTTSIELRLVKEKSFEAIFRAEQLGGIHAKSIIISFLDNTNLNQLKKDLHEFHSSQNCSVLGAEDLINESKNGILSKKLIDILQ